MPQVAALLFLILVSAFFSSSEISLASASKTRLQALADDGDRRAALVLDLQSHPGQFFSAIQIMVNATALLGGVIGDAAFSPFFAWVFEKLLPDHDLEHLAFVISFIIATMLFVIFADLLPKRLAIARPEAVAMFVVRPMNIIIKILRPLVYILERLSDACIRSLGMPTKRQETITSEDILASVGAGAAAGVIAPEEETVIQNVFELESRLVPSAMTARESVVFFTLDETDESIRAKIATVPFNRFLVCDKDLDHVVGFVDSKHLLRRVLEEQPISFRDSELLQGVQFIPDSLTLSEVLDVFQRTHTDFAVIINEYALVVGIITINDVMATVMGDLVTNEDDAQIIQRDDDTWLVDGATPIDDLEHALDIDELPEDSAYETVAGFMMYMLRKIPKRTDKVVCAGYTFEVMDVDHNKIDQVLITRGVKKSGPEKSALAALPQPAARPAAKA